MPFLRFLMVAMLLVGMPACAIFKKGSAAKPLAPPPQPAPAAAKSEAPLSIPQTRVQLPPPQPVAPEALKVEPPPAPEPAEPAPPVKPPRGRPTPAAAAPAPQPPPEQPAPTPAPVAEERPRMQEIISPEERKRLMDEINNRKREANDIVGDVSHRSLSAQQREMVDRIRGFVQRCDEASDRGDLRGASKLCELAAILARGLKNAR